MTKVVKRVSELHLAFGYEPRTSVHIQFFLCVCPVLVRHFYKSVWSSAFLQVHLCYAHEHGHVTQTTVGTEVQYHDLDQDDLPRILGNRWQLWHHLRILRRLRSCMWHVTVYYICNKWLVPVKCGKSNYVFMVFMLSSLTAVAGKHYF